MLLAVCGQSDPLVQYSQAQHSPKGRQAPYRVPFLLTWYDNKNVPLLFNPSPADGVAVRKPLSLVERVTISLKGKYYGIY